MKWMEIFLTLFTVAKRKVEKRGESSEKVFFHKNEKRGESGDGQQK